MYIKCSLEVKAYLDVMVENNASSDDIMRYLWDEAVSYELLLNHAECGNEHESGQGLYRYISERAQKEEIIFQQLKHEQRALWQKWLRGEITDHPVTLSEDDISKYIQDHLHI